MSARSWLSVLLVVGLLCSTQGATAQDDPLISATAAISQTYAESSAETDAMARAIDAAQKLSIQPKPSPAAASLATLARDLARTAKTSADFQTTAHAYGRAARLAPWVAEYQFRRGEFLQKSGLHAPAADAFALYLKAAPQAKDRDQVATLIQALRRLPPPETAARSSSAKGDALRDCPDCPEMVVIPGGRFKMGSAPTEVGRFDSEGPQHDVDVSAFMMAKHEVNQKEFTRFLAETAYQPAPCSKLLDKSWRSPGKGVVFSPGTADLLEQPAVCINWHDVQAYLAWLNKKLHAAKGANATPYRLPSEAEWEYAARGGTTTSRWWGEAIGVNQANCHGCGSMWDNTLIAPNGSFGPNPFGLYDMLGNVWQMTADCWNENYQAAPADGGPWSMGNCEKRVIREESWSNLPVFIRTAARSHADIAGSDFDFSSYVGFRIARSLR